MRQRYGPWLHRGALWSCVVLAAIELSFTANLAWSTFARSGAPQAGFGIDLSVYWSAAEVALKHGPVAVFDQNLMMAVGARGEGHARQRVGVKESLRWIEGY